MASEESTRARVYRLLAEGNGVVHAANLVGIAEQVARRHALRLEADGALRRVPGTRSPVLFERGPRASKFEEIFSAPPDRGVRSRGSGRTGVRLHHWGWSWRVFSGPNVEPVWERSWLASGVENVGLHQGVGEDAWWFHFIRGGKASRLVVRPPPVVVWDEAAVLQAEKDKGREVAKVVRAFAQRYGFTLYGSLEKAHPTEYGIPVPGLGAVGTAGASRVWADDSLGEAGLSELETRDAGIAAAVVSLPEWRADMARRLVGVSAELVAHREILTRLTVLTEEAALNARRVVSALVPPGPEVA